MRNLNGSWGLKDLAFFHIVCPLEAVSNLCNSKFRRLFFFLFLFVCKPAHSFLKYLAKHSKGRSAYASIWLFPTTFPRCTDSVGTGSAFHANKGDRFTKCFTAAEQGFPACLICFLPAYCKTAKLLSDILDILWQHLLQAPDVRIVSGNASSCKNRILTF